MGSRLDPEPSTSLGSGASISQWRREEIHALPRELLGQCLLTMQARERQAPEIPDQPHISTPPEDMGGVAMTSEDLTVRSMFGSDIHASCFAERERVRQMDTLMVMWSRGFVCSSISLGFSADFYAHATIYSAS